MYKQRADLLVFLLTVLLLPCHVSSFPSNTTRLSWHCLPQQIALFADLSCSIHGPSYPISRHGSPQLNAIDLQPRRSVGHSPWSYEPMCTGAIERVGSELCIYTNIEYAGGRGISIVTAPKIAEDFANTLLSFQNSTALDGLLLTGLVSVTPRTISKGRVALAKQDIGGGELVASNVPILVASPALDDLSGPEREEVLRAAVLQLPVPTQRLLAKLTWDSDDEYLLYGYCDYHAGFPVDVGGHSHFSLYPELSYFNHACGPNTQLQMDLSTLRTTFKAARNISQGEEITFSYFYPKSHAFHFHPFVERQQLARNRLGFTCSCSRCRQGTHADRGLEQLHQQQQALDDWSSGASATVEDALGLIHLYRKQGLDAFLHVPYRLAALAYSAVGDADRARRHAGMAAGRMAFEDLQEDPDFETCTMLREDPRRHWSWRVRKGE